MPHTVLSHDIDKHGVTVYWDVAETEGKYLPMHCIKVFEFEEEMGGTFMVHIHLPYDRSDAIINVPGVTSGELSTLKAYAHMLGD